MKHILLYSLLLTLFACNSSDAPDVSNIKADLEIVRFENDFFAIDTNNVTASMQALSVKHGGFVNDFTTNILGIIPTTDSSAPGLEAVKHFIHDYKPIYDSISKTFADMSDVEKELKRSLQYVKYYFPDYKTPTKLITYAGPMDAYFEASMGGYSDVITPAGLATGLQLHLGHDFSMYHSEMGIALYPAYISRRFTRETIAVNAIKNIIDDIYPEQRRGGALVDQMVEKGKRLYVLDKLMPHTADTLKIGYTDNQLKGCYSNEGRIWNFFVTNNLLLKNEPDILKSYVGDGPETPELGAGSPGYIALFTGWQIVKKYMEKKGDIPLMQLLQTPSRTIFEESKYRPK